MTQRRRAGILDIDGLLLDSTERLRQYVNIAGLERGDYNAYAHSFSAYDAAAGHDPCIPEGVALCNRMPEIYPVEELLVITSRGERSREGTMTQLWSLLRWELPVGNVYMRPDYVERGPGLVWEPGEEYFCHVRYKRSVVRALKQRYELVWAVDDHADVCAMYQAEGILAIHFLMPGVDCIGAAGDREWQREALLSLEKAQARG